MRSLVRRGLLKMMERVTFVITSEEGHNNVPFPGAGKRGWS